MYIALHPAKEFGLVIFDRVFKKGRSRFAEHYHPYIAGSLKYSDMIKAYKLHQVFLNVNLVRNSPTMFSRRVFELLACGTNVISTPAIGISKLFHDIVPIASSEEETKSHLSAILDNQRYRERLSLLGIREVYSRHLYKHRLDRILSRIGLQSENELEEGVSVIAYVEHDDSVKMILECYHQQVWKNKELIIVTNKENISIYQWMEAANSNDAFVYSLSSNKTIGECLQFAASVAKYPHIAIFGEEQYYASHYLLDLMQAFIYSGADIVGKGTYFMVAEGNRTLMICNPTQENRFVEAIPFSSMIIKKAALDLVSWPSNPYESSEEFFESCLAKGLKIYSADKYNYASSLKLYAAAEKDDNLCSKIKWENGYKSDIII